MPFKIFRLSEPAILEYVNDDGYHMSMLHRTVLEDIRKPYDFVDTHSTMDGAVAEIIKHKENLKHANLTIIPIFSVDWDGEFRE